MTTFREMSYVDAIIEGIAEEMRINPKIFHMSTEAPARLHSEFGFPRVRQTPIAESALTGMAIGAAGAGYRPTGLEICKRGTQKETDKYI